MNTPTPALKPERIQLAHGTLLLLRDWLPPRAAADYFSRLREQTIWDQSIITIAGRRVAIPRLNAWYGDAGSAYSYSGTRFEALPWSEPLLALKTQVQARVDEALAESPQLADRAFQINSALLNLYRDGADGVGWHSDNEASLGPRPQIASVSLGASRRFVLKPRRGSGEKFELELSGGSLLLMLGDLQAHWLHSVPKTARLVGPRINLTFRQIIQG